MQHTGDWLHGSLVFGYRRLVNNPGQALGRESRGAQGGPESQLSQLMARSHPLRLLLSQTCLQGRGQCCLDLSEPLSAAWERRASATDAPRTTPGVTDARDCRPTLLTRH